MWSGGNSRENTSHMKLWRVLKYTSTQNTWRGQSKIDWRSDKGGGGKTKFYPSPIEFILLCPACGTTAASFPGRSAASLSQMSSDIYLMRTDTSTYACVCMLFVTDGVTHYHLRHLLWCHCYDRPLKYGKPKCFDTHTDTVETLPTPPPLQGGVLYRLFQRVVSGWKATQKRCGSTRPGQNVSLIGINTMTSSGRKQGGDTFKTARKVYHNSSDHNGSVFHWGVVGALRVQNIYKPRVLVPVSDLWRENSGSVRHSSAWRDNKKREHAGGTNIIGNCSDADSLKQHHISLRHAASMLKFSSEWADC